MKLAIFGGTGRTGLLLVRKALDSGHEVTALARTPSKLVVRDERLRIIEGDARDPEAVEETIAGNEAVLSVMLQQGEAMKNILAAMEVHGVRRLVVSAGAGVPDPDDEPRLVNHLFRFLVKTFSREVYEDALRQNEILRASDVDWTICRAPMLMDRPEGKIKVTNVGRDMTRTLSRASFAGFLLSQVEDTRYIHKAPAISDGL